MLKAIPNHPDYYIDQNGSCWSGKMQRRLIPAKWCGDYGTLKWTLGTKAIACSSAILLTYHGPKPDRSFIATHLNGNDADWRPDNLAWSQSLNGRKEGELIQYHAVPETRIIGSLEEAKPNRKYHNRRQIKPVRVGGVECGGKAVVTVLRAKNHKTGVRVGGRALVTIGKVKRTRERVLPLKLEKPFDPYWRARELGFEIEDE